MSKAEEKTEVSVLFLCTGNYYRSRFAELYFNALAQAASLSCRAESRGLRLNPDNAGPIAAETVAWLEKKQIAVPSNHREPIEVSQSDLEAAGLVVALKEAEHRPLLARHFPAWVDKVEYWHIHDGDCATAEQMLPELAAKVEDLVRRIGFLANS